MNSHRTMWSRGAKPLPIATALLWMGVGACGGDGVTELAPDKVEVVGSIEMKPSQLYLDSLGRKVPLYARARGQDGTYLYSSVEYPERFSWSSSAPSVVGVDAAGSVTAASWGTSTITAAHQGGLTGTTRVTVRDAVRLAWSIADMGEVHAGIAIASDGAIYVTTTNRLFRVSPQGSVVWTLDMPAGMVSTPAIAGDGTLYVGSPVVGSSGGLTAVRPDGSIDWVVPEVGYIGSSPAVGSDGTIYVASKDGHVYAVDPEGEIRWSYESEHSFYLSSPAIATDGTVYIGGTDELLHAIKGDGSARWTFDAGSVIRGSPSIDMDGTIYFGTADHRLYAITPDGEERWSLPVHVTRSLSIGPGGTIYVGGLGVSAIDPGGTVRWNYAFNGGPTTPALGADGTVYVANTNGLDISALDSQGRLLWDYPTGSFPGGAPAISLDGTILATSRGGSLYALVENGSTNGGFEGSPWPKEHGNRANTGRSGG